MGEDVFSVKDQVVLVSGASRGIGRAIADGFAARGASVIITGRVAENRIVISTLTAPLFSEHFPIIETGWLALEMPLAENSSLIARLSQQLGKSLL